MRINTDNLLVLDDKQFKANFLGRILWFTITETRVSFEQLKEAFGNAGIDEKYLPKPISIRDAFRRATKVAEAKRIQLDNERYLNLLVREVKNGDDEMIRQLVREVVDSKNVRLEYTPVANMVLKNDKDFDAYRLPDVPGLLQEEKTALLNVGAEFDNCKDSYNGRAVRELVQKILNDMDPVPVRPSGGVYFAPERFADNVEALSAFVSEINQYSVSGDKSSMWHVPVINAEEHRAMVTESLEEQVKRDSQSLITETAKILKEGKTITQKAAEKYIQQVKDLKTKVEKYEEMLNTEIVSCQSIMDLALKQAKALLDKVEAA